VASCSRRSIDAFLHRPREELYDLRADPDEVNNLADEPAHRETLERLHAQLKDWQKQTGDPWQIKYLHE
jgi:N-sulfoglucosamine sulfohydrolase